MSLLTPADLAALKADLIRWNVGALVVFTGICVVILELYAAEGGR